MTNNTAQQGKTLSIVAYLTIIGSVIALIMNQEDKNPFTAFHVRQGLGLCLTYMFLGYFISNFDNWTISTAFWIGFGILFFYGIIGAITGKTNQVPFLDAFYQNIFANLNK